MSEMFTHWENCYGCGNQNPHSHGVVRERAANGDIIARVHIDEYHGGAKGIAHGGHLVFLMDEVMGGVGVKGDPHRVTTAMEVNFRRPIPLGSDVIVAARIEERDDKGLKIRSTVSLEGSDDVAAEVLATFRFVDLKRLRNKFSEQSSGN